MMKKNYFALKVMAASMGAWLAFGAQEAAPPPEPMPKAAAGKPWKRKKKKAARRG
jgi:hypothetical protein